MSCPIITRIHCFSPLSFSPSSSSSFVPSLPLPLPSTSSPPPSLCLSSVVLPPFFLLLLSADTCSQGKGWKHKAKQGSGLINSSPISGIFQGASRQSDDCCLGTKDCGFGGAPTILTYWFSAHRMGLFSRSVWI